MSKPRHIQASMLLIPVLLSGCCGSALWSGNLQPEEVSYEVRIPAAVHVSKDRETLVVPLAVTNTSGRSMCFGKPSNSGWQGGLQPKLQVDVGDAPVVAGQEDVDLSGLHSENLKDGRTAYDWDRLRLRVHPNDNATPGSAGDVRWRFSIADPKNPDAKYPVSEGVMETRLLTEEPSLLSEPQRYPSESSD